MSKSPHATGVELDVTEEMSRAMRETYRENSLVDTSQEGRKGRRPIYPLRRLSVRPAKRGRQEASLRR